MNDIEQKLVELFSKDEATFSAVYNALRASIETKRDVFTRTIHERKTQTNEQIGANIRAFDEAVHLVDSVFRELRARSTETAENSNNPGR